MIGVRCWKLRRIDLKAPDGWIAVAMPIQLWRLLVALNIGQITAAEFVTVWNLTLRRGR